MGANSPAGIQQTQLILTRREGKVTQTFQSIREQTSITEAISFPKRRPRAHELRIALKGFSVSDFICILHQTTKKIKSPINSFPRRQLKDIGECRRLNKNILNTLGSSARQCLPAQLCSSINADTETCPSDLDLRYQHSNLSFPKSQDSDPQTLTMTVDPYVGRDRK